MSVNLRQLWHVCRFEVARRLRSAAGVISLVALVIASVVVGRQLARAAQMLEEASTGEQADAFEMVMEMVASLAEFPLGTVRASLEAHSPPLVGAFAFLMFVTPVLAFSMGYDQCASAIETRHARFLAFRIDRTTLYLGKLMGAWALVSMTIAAAAVSMAGYIWIRGGAMPGVMDVVYLVRIIVTVAATALPLLALLGLLGTLRGRARRVALLAILWWLGVALAGAAARHGLELAWLADAIEALWPTTGRWPLILDDGGPWLMSAARVAVYTAVAGLLGLLHFGRRDL